MRTCPVWLNQRLPCAALDCVKAHTCCWEQGVVFLVTPCLQFALVVCIWKVVLRVIASEEEGTEPDGFFVVVVLWDREVGDCVPKMPELALVMKNARERIELYHDERQLMGALTSLSPGCTVLVCLPSGYS